MFFTMSISVEMVMPIRTANVIYLMVVFVIYTFEGVRTWLLFFSSCLISFLVFYATLHFFSVVFHSVSSIVLGVSGNMRLITKYHVAPLPTVFTLWNT